MYAFGSQEAWAGTPLALSPHWYACYTRAHHEKKVHRLLPGQGVESFLPLVTQSRRWTDRTKEISVALFPSYVFARFSMSQLHQVLAVPGVAAVVRRDGRPIEISEEEVLNVRRFAESLSQKRLEPQLVRMPEKGARVRIVEGPFAGVAGVVCDHRNRSRVLVGLTAIGLAVQVEVDAGLVEPSDG
jgi:transcription antitermination factor NusG